MSLVASHSFIYEYDNFGRLVKVFDHKNILLKEYQYNYRK